MGMPVNYNRLINDKFQELKEAYKNQYRLIRTNKLNSYRIEVLTALKPCPSFVVEAQPTIYFLGLFDTGKKRYSDLIWAKKCFIDFISSREDLKEVDVV